MKEWWRIRFPCKLQAMARPRDGSSLLHSNFVQLFFCGNKDIFIHEQRSGLQDLSGTREDMLWDRAFPGAEHAITMA
jgi:hypothetical protein